MITIRVSEARNKLSALLDQVERGETVVITRRGVPVARLVPDASAIETRQAQDAMMRMRARVSEIRLGPFDWDDLNEIETQADHKDRLDSREEYSPHTHGLWVPRIARLLEGKAHSRSL